MKPPPHEVAALLGAWCAYFAIHSALASLRVKRWVAARWSQLMPLYRLVYNTLALVLLVPPLWLTSHLEGALVWRWEGPWRWLGDGLAAAAILGFLWSLRYYDGAEFLGLRQLRSEQRVIEDQERFYVSPLHRYVRHPWYSLALVILWTRDMNTAFLVTSAAITLYFVFGSRLEERKLIVYHGDVYRQYRALVPALVPLPWRHLDRAGAAELEAAAARPRRHIRGR